MFIVGGNSPTGVTYNLWILQRKLLGTQLLIRTLKP